MMRLLVSVIFVMLMAGASSAQLVANSFTERLYHFDGDLSDESSNGIDAVDSNSSFVDGKFGQGLYGTVKIPSDVWIDDGFITFGDYWTIEFYWKQQHYSWSGAEDVPIFWQAPGNQDSIPFQIMLRGVEPLYTPPFNFREDYTGIKAQFADMFDNVSPTLNSGPGYFGDGGSGTFFEADTLWHHIVFMRRADYIYLVVDDVCADSANVTGIRATAAHSNMYIGGGVGYVDDLRLSTESMYLPVELTSFTASVDGLNVQLNWETESETNNLGFNILRSRNTSPFFKVNDHLIRGAGTTVQKQEYSFIDTPTEIGTYSYQIEQIDVNGNKSYSEIVEAAMLTTSISVHSGSKLSNSKQYQMYSIRGKNTGGSQTGIYIKDNNGVLIKTLIIK